MNFPQWNFEAGSRSAMSGARMRNRIFAPSPYEVELRDAIELVRDQQMLIERLLRQNEEERRRRAETAVEWYTLRSRCEVIAAEAQAIVDEGLRHQTLEAVRRNREHLASMADRLTLSYLERGYREAIELGLIPQPSPAGPQVQRQPTGALARFRARLLAATEPPDTAVGLPSPP